ncbi:MAG: endopeptidase La [Clostridia bacterium]|nr:endopeptidase La [Clostridia bacterium]
MTSGLIYKSIPVIPLRGIVVFPKLRFHFEVGRKKSIAAVDMAMEDDQRVLLLTQRDINIDEPEISDLYKVGVIAVIRQVTKDSETDSYKIVVETEGRAVISKVLATEECFICDAKEAKSRLREGCDYELAAAVRTVRDSFADYVSNAPADIIEYSRKVFFTEDPYELSDEIANTVLTKYEDRQAVLGELDVLTRLETLNVLLRKELEILRCEIDIENRTQAQIDKNQREYYLREKMRAISTELGGEEEPGFEMQSYKEKIENLDCSDEVREKLLYECSKIAKMQSGGADASVVRVYLDTALALPFGKYTNDNFNLTNARKQLDKDHFGLNKIKERFIEMLAVKERSDDVKGQIICLVGPPGVGKTSIVRSIAEAMGRKYVRLALGGVNDEAEIRGHRKTYIGSMPGRIINALTQAKSMNPIVLLDEIDKLGTSYKGDPASALLEVLDPEQNNTFRDNYLEFPVDLSKVLFITTANDASAIPSPLFDRMEIIDLSSYTPEEKLMIAKNHLIKKQMKLHSLTAKEVRFTDRAIKLLIDGYTREAGVRRLEQVISSLLRKCVVCLSEKGVDRISITPDKIKELLGPEKYLPELIEKDDLVGVVNGLAYTSVGGTITQIEVVTVPGTGKIELTGSLGDVMKESAKTALTYVHSVADRYGIDPEVFTKKDIHIHAPEGAVPKDGPSAGVTMATAILSALGKIKVDRYVTMTGEISLTGRVMKIGGLREKSMAAYKSGAKKVIIPRDNMPDLWEIDPKVRESLEFIPVSRIDEVFSLALKSSKTFDVSAKSTVSFTHRGSSIKAPVQNKRRKSDEI